jgi:hypothetical protein
MAMFPIVSLLWFGQLTMTDGAHVSGHRVTRQA